MTTPFRLLIVDDNRSLVEALAVVFESRGYAVDLAYDGMQALERVRNGTYDCILMDIRMPNMSGVDAFREIKKLSPKTPVILMTAYSVQGLIDEALADGVFAVLHKPVGMEQILEMVEGLRGNSSAIIVDVQPNPDLIQALKAKGFRVAEVSSATAALERLSNHQQDIIFLNAGIPHLTTEDSMILMKECNPKCIIILISSEPAPTTSPLVYSSLQKPFKIKQVLDLIERVRASAGSGESQ